MQSYIKKSTCLCIPYLCRNLGDGYYRIYGECKKPVVNSNIGWSQELIKDGESGFLVHPSNHNEYATKVVEVLKDNELRKKIGTKARERVEQLFIY